MGRQRARRRRGRSALSGETTFLVRPAGPALARGERTYVARTAVDVSRAAAQHRALLDVLHHRGLATRSLPARPHLPDAVFVEDLAVILPEVAVVARPAADNRRRERADLDRLLPPDRPVRRIRPPATLEGGDVLVSGRTLFVGRSTRTDAGGAAQLGAAVEPWGYRVREVEVRGCLHLKTGAGLVAPGVLLANRDWVDADAIAGHRVLEVEPAEPWAANTVYLGERREVLMLDGFPGARARVEEAGSTPVPVDLSELLRAEGGVSCLLLRVPGAPAP